MSRETTKITINISVDLLKRVKEYGDKLSINRTSAMCVLMNQALEYKGAMDMAGNMTEVLSKMEEIGRMASKKNEKSE